MARTRINSDQMAVNPSEFESANNGQLTLKATGVANSKLAHDSVTVVAGDGLVGGGEVDLGASITLNVNPDNSGIELDSDALRLKDSGVSTAKLADDAVTAAKIGADAVKPEHLHADVAGPGIEQHTDGSLQLKLEASSFELQGDELQIKDAGIAPAFLHADIAGDGLGQNAGSKALEVKVDNSGIEINSDALRLKDSGVSTAKIANDAVTADKIADDQVKKEHLAADVVGDGLQQDADGHLKAKLEGASLEISNGGLRIKEDAVAGTGNQISVSYADGLHTVSLPNAITAPGSLTVTGDFVVNGTSMTANSTVVSIEDNMMELARGQQADSLDIGFYGQYRENNTDKFAGFFRDQANGRFRLFDSLTTAPGNTVDQQNANMAKAELELEKMFGNVKGDIEYNNARTFALAGDLSGSATFSGNDDPTITATIVADSVEKGMINANVAGDGLSRINTGELKVNVDDSSIAITGDGLHIKNLGVSTAKLANDAVTADKIGDDQVKKEHLAADVRGPGIVQDNDGSLRLSVDNASIELNVDELRIKDSGVVTAKIADQNVTNAKLQNDSLTFTYNGLSGPAGGQALGSSVALSVDQFGEVFAQADMSNANTRFTLSPGVGKNIADNLKPMVFLNGMLQEEGANADYVWDSGNGHITFADAIDGDDRGSVIYFRK